MPDVASRIIEKIARFNTKERKESRERHPLIFIVRDLVFIDENARGEGSGAPGTVLDDRLTIACGEGAVRLHEIQRAGKQPMKAGDFLRGTAVASGTVLR